MPGKVRVSSGSVGGLVNHSYYGLAVTAMPDNPTLGFHRTSVRAVAVAAEVRRTGEPTTAIFSNTAIYPPILYLPALAAVAATRLFSDRPLAEFYVGRLINVLCCVALLLWIIRRTLASRYSPPPARR